MKKWIIIGGVVFVTATTTIAMVSKYNYAVKIENQIEAVWEDNQNVLSQYSLKIKEAAKVPDMYKDDLKEVVTSALSSRYGESGSQATFQWLKEHNISIDSAMYTNLQQIIEAGRTKFENSQTRLIDIKKSYNNSLDVLIGGTMLSVMGFPKIDMDKYNIVKSEMAIEVFKKGVDTGVDF